MFEIAEYIGVVAFVISGFLVGVRAKLDYLGVLISAFLTALGGGILRDVIVNKTPYSFSHIEPGVTILLTFALMIVLQKKASIENRFLFILSDSIGLVSFSISGALVAIENNLNLTGVLSLAFLTAVGGGIARDIIINEVPFVFKTGFYGTISLLIGLLIYLLKSFNNLNYLFLTILFFISLFLRLIAYYKKWEIPKP